MFQIKRGDRRPYLQVVLEERTLDDNDQVVVAPYDLTGLSVRFLMKNKSTGVIKVDGTATIVDAEAGEVRWQWGATDTDTVGVFQVEWEIDFGSGVTQTVPGVDYQLISVTQDLG